MLQTHAFLHRNSGSAGCYRNLQTDAAPRSGRTSYCWQTSSKLASTPCCSHVVWMIFRSLGAGDTCDATPHFLLCDGKVTTQLDAQTDDAAPRSGRTSFWWQSSSKSAKHTLLLTYSLLLVSLSLACTDSWCRTRKWADLGLKRSSSKFQQTHPAASLYLPKASLLLACADSRCRARERADLVLVALAKRVDDHLAGKAQLGHLRHHLRIHLRGHTNDDYLCGCQPAGGESVR